MYTLNFHGCIVCLVAMQTGWRIYWLSIDYIQHLMLGQLLLMFLLLIVMVDLCLQIEILMRCLYYWIAMYTMYDLYVVQQEVQTARMRLGRVLLVFANGIDLVRVVYVTQHTIRITCVTTTATNIAAYTCGSCKGAVFLVVAISITA
jgi:hypothetical protein